MQLKMSYPHIKGETILETIIAMGILAIGITLASTIIASSLRNINGSKNRIIAVNIAREGIEAVRNIRDTNWLKFNSRKRECWNHDPADNSCTNTSEAIAPGEYIIYKQNLDEADAAKGWKWRLEEIHKNPQGSEPENSLNVYFNTTNNTAYAWNGSEWADLTQLYRIDADPLVDSDGDHNYTNDQDAYNHAYVGDENALGKGSAQKTAFRRVLKIEYLGNSGTVMDRDNYSTIPDPENYNCMRVTVVINWQEGKFPLKTSLVTHLTDYFGREKLAN